MNGPQRTVCFANRRCQTRHTHTDTQWQCAVLRFTPALNEPLRNNNVGYVLAQVLWLGTALQSNSSLHDLCIRRFNIWIAVFLNELKPHGPNTYQSKLVLSGSINSKKCEWSASRPWMGWIACFQTLVHEINVSLNENVVWLTIMVTMVTFPGWHGPIPACRHRYLPNMLRGYLGVPDALFQYLWKHSIFEVMCFESP